MTMMNAVKTLDRANKTISASKDFLMKAGKFGTPEFAQAMELRAKYPGYTIVPHTIARNASKTTYGNLTYKVMEDFILNHETDEAVRKAVWEEYQIVRKVALTYQKGAYTSVKKWFLDKYKAVFDAEKEAKKAAAEEARMQKLMLTEDKLALPTTED